MKSLFPLHGIVTVLNTPFDTNNAIDFHALKLNVDDALAAGVAGFLVPAMASEVQKLSHEEKRSMVEVVLERVNGKVPVFAGTAGKSVDDSISTLKSFMEMGCRHVLIQLPYSSETQFKLDFLRLADCNPEVIMLQDWDASGYGLPDHLIMDLFEHVPAFRCLKVETNPAGIKYSKMLQLSNGTLNVSGGWAVSQMPEGLKRGVHAFMPTGMHWIYTKIFRDYQEGKLRTDLRR
jgi:dihydrodipicolinate synthase/N-acetylneuraminate lyase